MNDDWRNECVIIPNYMPPYPRPETKPACVVFHLKTDSFLRFEDGTNNIRSEFSSSENYFWDVYGTNFQTIEFANEALEKTSKPPFCKPYVEYVIKLTEGFNYENSNYIQKS